ncbi:hypothetical protein CC1G_06257 [Coprinopsis cinerea okayama7|uniref:BTB domain-containing protein n=1 Tax=Coprinopsis cinerea (strain Okayama-7 / 130 / ATCC MYA-4618 / FGSC 9003) TaxID=240176 RepID=A8NVE4_COPC7|nr:hypothetical protein CC1G_06257 [Coprinopsis cinerea okayama7\|eukprot:XP_001836670.2 hypothetical protein CC1G_06257 [Coprinopsis cinerea okayama7\
MPTRDSQEFNAPDADIIFQSSDGVRFHIHAKNLDVSSGAFPPVPPKGEAGSGLSVDEVVPLPESSKVLEVLFAFMYPRRHPDLEDKAFDDVAEIAEAVEKYEVYPGMNVCRRRMRDFVKTHPIQVALYGARHDYIDIIKETAPYAVALPLSKVIPNLPPRLVLPWIKYHEAWDKVRDAFFYFTSNDHDILRINDIRYCYNSGVWRDIVGTITRRYRKAIAASSSNPLYDLDALFNRASEMDSTCCAGALKTWKNAVAAERNKIPGFADFISRHTQL